MFVVVVCVFFFFFFFHFFNQDSFWPEFDEIQASVLTWIFTSDF